MNKFLIILVLCTFNFALFVKAEEDTYSVKYWSWRNCQETFIKYSQYRETSTSDVGEAEASYFDCGENYKSTEYREKCQETKKSLSDTAKNYYDDCVIPYYEQYYSNSNNESCIKEVDECLFCRRQDSCKTVDSNTSPKQADADKFEQNQLVECQIDAKCPTTIGKFALSSCKTNEKEKCSLEWEEKNIPDDPCVIKRRCQYDNVNFSLISNFSLLALLAYLAL